MQAPKRTRRSSLAGTVAILTDIGTPFGCAIARRLATETVALTLGGVGSEVARALAEVQRVRTLSRIEQAPLAILADPATDEGAAEILDAALSAHGRVESVIHAVQPAQGQPCIALDPLLAMLRRATTAMKRQQEGRILLALDLCSEEQVGLFPAARARIAEAFETLIQLAAYRHYGSELRINGLIVDRDYQSADGALALAGMSSASSGTGHSSIANAYVAACGVVSLLASASSCGITGQVFRIGASPPRPVFGSDIAAFLDTSLRLP